MITSDVKITPVPANVLAQVTDLVNQIASLLQPYLHALTPGQRKILPKMADKTVSFISKALEFANSNSQFAPAYLDVKSLSDNVTSVTELTQVENPLASLSMQLSDTVMIAGSEAYVAALTFYNSVKEAARRNVPGAKPIADDLKKRFEQSHKSDKDADKKDNGTA